MARQRGAIEEADLEVTLERLRVTEDFVERLLVRLRRFVPLPRGSRVLDIGAAQGFAVLAFQRAGMDVIGLEPSAAAIEVGGALARREGEEVRIRAGVAEELPFEADSFEFVYLYAVLEHVDDPERVLRECFRVLSPGGSLFFMTGSAQCPMQNEIRWFPLFPWYPDRLRRRIMAWARDNRPQLVGYTSRPAFFWFRHGETRDLLRRIGFDPVDRWELRTHERGTRGALIRAAASNAGVRFAANTVVQDVEFLAIKRWSGAGVG